MNIETTLLDFRGKIDERIKSYLDRVEEKASQEDPLVGEALFHVRELILAGGKRLRGALVAEGYRAAGGRDESAILDVCVGVELLHAFLLIHDDIIDRDPLRHGVPTLHERYATFAQKHFRGADTAHFGDSVALIVGDMVFAFGNDAIFHSAFPKELVFRALSKMQDIVTHTVIGQARDIFLEYQREATESEILKMYTNKTARYTMEGPIHMGLILGNAEEKLGPAFSRYALPLGIAFQIQDDILGVFGSEKRIGKPVGSDIAEGKITLLVTYARETASSADREELNRILSLQEALTATDVDRFRDIVQSSGALDRAKKLSLKYIEEGAGALGELEPLIPKTSVDFFRSLSEFLLKREY